MKQKLNFLFLFIFTIGIFQIKAQTGLSCASAQNLTLSIGQTTINGVYQSSEFYWYSFTANRGSHGVQIENLKTNPRIRKITAYSGTTCSSLTVIGSDSIGEGIDSTLIVLLSPTINDSTYYIKLERDMGCMNCSTDSSFYNLLLSPVEQVGCGVRWWINGFPTSAFDPPTNESGVSTGNSTTLYHVYLCPDDVFNLYPYVAGDVGDGSSVYYYNLVQFNPGPSGTFSTTSGPYNHDPNGTIPQPSFSYGAGTYTIMMYGNSVNDPIPTSPENQDFCWALVIHMMPPGTPGAFSVNPNPVCINECAVLTSVFPPPPQPFASFSTNAPINTYVTCQDGFIFNTPGTYSISMENPSQGCSGFPVTQTISVKSPTFTMTYTVEPCTYNYTFIESVGCTGNTYDYFFDVNNVGITSNTTGIFHYTFPGPGTYTAVGLSSADYNDVYTYTIVVPAFTPINPVINITASSLTICASNTATLAAGGANTYTWSTSENTAEIVVNPTVTTSYTVFGADACGTGSAVVTVTVINSPTLTITPSQTICAGVSTTLTTNGASNYTWSPGTSTATTIVVAPTSTTVYSVTGNTSCGSSSISTTLTVVANPTINASAAPASTICIGNTTTLTATGATSYTWNPGTLAGTSVTVSPAITTTYTVTGTGESGCIGTKTIAVNVITSPIVTSIPSSNSVCPGASATLTASGGTSYTWSPGSSLNTTTGSSVIATPTINTVYTVSATTLCGIKTSTVLISFIPNPTVTASSAVICPGTSTVLTASGATSYTWQPVNVYTNSISVTPTVATVYTVTGNNICGATATETVKVSFFKGTPSISASASPSLICAGSSSTLTATAPAGSWIFIVPGSMTSGTVVSPTVTTTYTAVATNTTTGCSNSAVITVSVNPFTGLTVTPSTICAGQSSTISASGAISYTWSTGANTSSIVVSPSVSTIYSLTATGASCTANTTVTLTVNPNPTVTAVASPTAICSGYSSTLTAGGATSYSWSPIASSSSSVTITPAVTTIYTVTGTTAAGCSNSNTISVTVAPSPTISIAATKLVMCTGETATLTASGASSYSWNTGAITASIAVTPTAITVYSVTGTTGVCSTTKAITIIKLNPPNIIATASPSVICPGNSSTLIASASGLSASSFTWQPISVVSYSAVVSPTATTIYTVTGKNAGCSRTQTATVNVTPLNVTVNSATICAGSSATLIASGASTYTWNPGNLTGSSMSPSPTVTTNYTVMGTTASGCTTTVFSTVTVDSNTSFSVSATSSSYYPIAGNSVTVTASVSPAGTYTYVWAPNIGNTASVTFTPNDNAAYSCNVTNACGTISSPSICINVESTLCNSTSDVTLNNAVITNTALIETNRIYTITGTLTIVNSDVTFINCIIKMGTDAKIIVDPGSSVSFNQGSKVFSCGSMWFGIDAQRSSSSAGVVKVSESTIEDAYHAINADNTSVNSGNPMQISASILNKNYIDINLLNGDAIYSYPLSIATSTLSSASSTTSPGNSLKCSSFYSPSYKSRSYAGVLAQDVGVVDFTNDDRDFNTFNLVQNKDYGLYFDNTNANVYYATFSDAIGIQDNSFGNLPSVPKGVGIFSKNSGYLNVTTAATPTSTIVYFNNLGYGVITNNTYSVDVQYTDHTSSAQSYSINPSTGISGTGLNNIYATDAKSLLRINNNNFSQTYYPVTASYSATPNSGMIMSIASNTIEATGTGIISTGVNIQASSPSLAFTTSAGNLRVAANTFSNVEIGVKVLSVGSGSLQISNNNIRLKTSTVRRCGVYLAGNNNGVVVDHNTIHGGYTGSSGAAYSYSNVGVYAVSSSSCFVQCNTITQTGHGVEFNGVNSSSANGFINNTLNYPMRRGLVLSNGGLIGTQGSSTGASANTWNNFVNISGVDQTLVGGPLPYHNVSNSASSPLWVRDNSAELPTDNSIASPSGVLDAYALAASINTITGSSDFAACTSSLTAGLRMSGASSNGTDEIRDHDFVNYIMNILPATNNDFTPQDKFTLKQYMFEDLSRNPSTNDTLVNFYNQEQATSINTYYQIDSLLATGNVSLANNTNTGAPVNNDITQTQNSFNALYINGITNQTELDNLNALANLCPSQYGNAVYQARALYQTITYSNKEYSDSCYTDKLYSRMGYVDKTEKSVSVAEGVNAKLYPNPNNGTFTLAYDLKTNNQADVLISDITGKLVYSIKVNDLDNMIQINTNHLQSGLYFVQLLHDKTLLWTDKLMISK